MPEYVFHRSALEAERLARARALLSSPLVAQSTLGGTFRQSRGFALTFTREGEPEVLRRFPELEPFIECVHGEPAALEPLWRRALRRPLPAANAFYVNLLLVGPGGRVGRHTDATLRGPTGDDAALPSRVTVLYLCVPRAARGGELRLYRSDRPVAVIRPEPGAVVHFRGDLQHEVTAFEGADDVRASLVCEQYALGDAALARLRPLHVQSRGGFDAYLQSHQRRDDV